MTTEQKERLEKDLTAIAREPLTFEIIKDCFYAFGSELATLRLVKAFRLSQSAHQNYSSNIDSFFFSLELNR